MRRVTEVFDCWFESGSMPYAQNHYPFDGGTKEYVENNLPADFIAEGLDQTRGWFYTLHVLAGALFDRPAFKHVIVNGLVLAEDVSAVSALPSFDNSGMDGYAVRGLAVVTMNVNRHSTSCWSRWTVSKATKASSSSLRPTVPMCSILRCCAPVVSTVRWSCRCRTSVAANRYSRYI